MDGLIMDTQLLLSRLIQHAAECHGDKEIISREMDGSIFRYTYSDSHQRIKRLAKALIHLGVQPGDRVASLAWNTHRHFELFYAVTGIGAVLNTVNPRLHANDMSYIINHGGSRILFVDEATDDLAEKVIDHLPNIEKIILLAPENVSSNNPNRLLAENLLSEQTPEFTWPSFSEKTASILCFTAGTSGKPKGVLYSHRATMLQVMYASGPGMMASWSNGCRPVFMPIAAMYHGNGWNMPFLAPYNGANLVLCGRDHSPASLLELMTAERVTLAAAVPTVWMDMVEHANKNGKSLGSLRQALTSGSSAPASMFDNFMNHDVELTQTYGLTEAVFATGATLPTGATDSLTPEEIAALRQQSGKGHSLIELRIVDDEGNILPWDGKTSGHLQLRGPWVVNAYFNSDANPLDENGWFITGDVVTINSDGGVTVRDRTKDVIKSGGEWISSLELESVARTKSGVKDAAVFAIPHSRWQERPMLLVVLKEGSKLTPEDMRIHLKNNVAKWWVPERIEFVEHLPLTSVGKVNKRALRKSYAKF